MIEAVGRDRSTIVFFPEGSFGPTNNCVGIGNVLRARGHRVVFVAEESFAGSSRDLSPHLPSADRRGEVRRRSPTGGLLRTEARHDRRGQCRHLPALFSSGIPWTRIVSCNPAEMKDHEVPPPSGLPTENPGRLG
jgi:UDP:flavonoid glycosyltransferase YjiC (YdhE family)